MCLYHGLKGIMCRFLPNNSCMSSTACATPRGPGGAIIACSVRRRSHATPRNLASRGARGTSHLPKPCNPWLALLSPSEPVRIGPHRSLSAPPLRLSFLPLSSFSSSFFC